MWLLPSTSSTSPGCSDWRNACRIARRKRLIAVNGLLQVAGDQPPDAIEHPAHGPPPAGSRGSFRSLLLASSYTPSVAIWFTPQSALFTEIKPCRRAFAHNARFGQCAANRNHLETMPRLSRRSFLAASAAFAARPAVAAPAAATGSGPLDVVIIGAGAAGIAAARKIAAAGRRYLLIEATDHIGGRCITDTTTFGVPYDRGAHWIYLPDFNPLTKLAPRRGDRHLSGAAEPKGAHRPPLMPARANSRIFWPRKSAPRAPSTTPRARPTSPANRRCRTISATGVRRSNSCSARTIAAKDLTQMSSLDFARAAERNAAAFCKQGFGALLAVLAQGLTVQLSTPARSDRHQKPASRSIRRKARSRPAPRSSPFRPTSSRPAASNSLPSLITVQSDAFGRLSLGSYDHIALELAGNPLGLEATIWCSRSPPTRIPPRFSPTCPARRFALIDVAGAFGRDLSAHGEAAMFDFRRRVAGRPLRRRSEEGDRPQTGDALEQRSVSRSAHGPPPRPGGEFARRQLFDPISDDVWYAGEAAHETLWGTVGGAWESGERAADAVLRRLGPVKAPAPAESESARHTQDRACPHPACAIAP